MAASKPFKWRHFQLESILRGVRWYLQYSPLRRWGRYWGLLIGAVCLTFGFAVATPAQTPITWKDLQPPSTLLQDPYPQLSTEQTYELSTLARLQTWVKENQASPDSREAQEVLRLENRLREQGLDVAALLSQVDQARAYWRHQSQFTNPNLEGQSVKLSGYALPLSWNEARQMTAFLLVPYVGACIHVPPPPPNQIVYIKPASALEPPGLFAPVAVEGQLRRHPASYELFRVDGSRQVEVSYALTLTNLTQPSPETPIAAIEPAVSLPAGPWWRRFQVWVSAGLTQEIGNLHRQRSASTFFWGLLIAFSYGVLHTLGPGHGKAVIISYFVGQGGSLRRGLIMGVRIAAFHVLSAIVVVVFTDTVIRQSSGGASDNYQAVQLISYGAIATIGGWMLWQAIQSLRTPYLGAKAANLMLYPSLTQQAFEPKPPTLPKNQTAGGCRCLTCVDPKGMGDWLSLAVGAVPCSGALLVLLYGLANNLLWPSVAMVIAISVGMAITLSWIGIMAIAGRQYAERRLGHHRQRYPQIHQVVSIVGASCVLLMGLGLFGVTLVTTGEF